MRRSWISLFLFLLLITSCKSSREVETTPPCFNISSNTSLPTKPGPVPGMPGRFLLPNDTFVYETGITIYTGGYPMQPFITDAFLLVTDNDQRGNNLQHLTIYNLETGKKFSIPAHTFRGIWAEREGGYIDIIIGTGWKGSIEEIQFNPANGEYQQLHSIKLEGFISDMVLDRKHNSLFAFNLSNGSIWKVDLTLWKAEKIARTGAAIYDAVLTGDGRYLLLTDWTGDSIIRYEITTGNSDKLKVGKFPEEIVTIPGETTAYVSISGEDSLVKFDYQNMRIRKKISLQDFDKKGLTHQDLPSALIKNGFL